MNPIESQRKAAPASGNASTSSAILATTKSTKDFVIASIADDGIGMPEEVKNRIFEPFFTTKEVGRGTGQGLAIAYGLFTDKLKGKIIVESVEGKGTTFILKIPRNIEDQEVSESIIG